MMWTCALVPVTYSTCYAVRSLWERLELTTIGIPPPSFANKSKIIFTTRSKVVCGDMEANEKILVPCLVWSQAWDLFQSKVGIICSDPEIQPLAETVAKECDGLPLALTVIGKTMASKTTAREWKDAITVLQEHAERLTGMEKVFSVLKYSYDDLEDDSIRSCFLFFSVYPEDYIIWIPRLVEQWIGKGYIDGFDEWEEAINIGHRNIGILRALSLLEFVKDYYVKMHDVIRDMAHWIEKDKILVIEEAGFSEARRTETLMKAQSITVWSSAGLEWLGDKPDCPNVTTFLLNLYPASLSSVSDDFFRNAKDLEFILNNQRLLYYTMHLKIEGFRADTKTIKLALSPLPSSSLSCFTLAYMKRLLQLRIYNYPEMEELLLSCLPDDTEIPLFQSLEEMYLSQLPKLVVTWEIRNLNSQCFRNLRQVTLDSCASMTNVSWLLLAPNLQKLNIERCEGIEEIISNASGACEESTFSNLKTIKIGASPKCKARMCERFASSFP